MRGASVEVANLVKQIGEGIERASRDFGLRMDASSQVLAQTTDNANERSKLINEQLDELRASIEKTATSIEAAAQRLTLAVDQIRMAAAPQSEGDGSERIVTKLDEIGTDIKLLVQGIASLTTTMSDVATAQRANQGGAQPSAPQPTLRPQPTTGQRPNDQELSSPKPEPRPRPPLEPIVREPREDNKGFWSNFRLPGWRRGD